MVKDGNTYYLFYEAHISTSGNTVLVYSTSSDGLSWTYGSKIMDASNTGSNNLSFPYVIKVNGQWYMIPDLNTTRSAIYRASSFPTGWHEVQQLMTAAYTFADAAMIQWNGYWYIFVQNFTAAPKELRLFYSETLGGTWTEHPSSPLYTGDENTRPGGRMVLRESTIDLFLQDSVIRYGEKVRKYTITELTPTTYVASEAAESPLLESTGSGWNSLGLHTLDRVDAGLSVVDGQTTGAIWSIGIYRDVP